MSCPFFEDRAFKLSYGAVNIGVMLEPGNKINALKNHETSNQFVY